jgi:hypothetical protein
MENENLNKKEIEMKNISRNTIVIDDHKSRDTRRSNINFSTNYLSLAEQLKLILKKHFIIYTRNIGVLIFMFISPIFFLTILQFLQTIAESYSDMLVTKEQPIIDLSSIPLKCNIPPCIGISILVIYFLYRVIRIL